LEEGMGFKKIKKEFSFADVVLESSKKNNRSIKKMQHLNKSINWNRVEDILMNHYTVGTSSEGADAYPPLLLFKCLLIQFIILIEKIFFETNSLVPGIDDNTVREPENIIPTINVFKTTKKRNIISHVGLVVTALPGNIEFIHSTTNQGVIISSLAERYWYFSFTEARRIL